MRSIFHIRLQDFEIQTERMLDASLRTRPLAIISSHHQNGTIVALSKEAEAEGLSLGLPVSLARKMSHSVLLLPYNDSLYHKVNSYVYENISRYSPLIEQEQPGQYYADMSGMDNLYKDFVQAAYVISKNIREKVDLEGKVGISENKLVSRISTAVIPETIYEISKGEESRFLAPLHSGVLPSSYEKTVEKMIRFLFLDEVKHIQTITDHADEAEIIFGRIAKRLYMESRGRDHSLVKPPLYKDHILKQLILKEDTNDVKLLEAGMRSLAEQTAYELRQKRQIAKSLKVDVFYTDGFSKFRKGKIIANDDDSVVKECLRLFKEANYRRNRIRAMMLDTWDFEQVVDQLDLFDAKSEDNRAVSSALDKIRDKFGFFSISTAAGLYTKPKQNSLAAIA